MNDAQEYDSQVDDAQVGDVHVDAQVDDNEVSTGAQVSTASNNVDGEFSSVLETLVLAARIPLLCKLPGIP